MQELLRALRQSMPAGTWSRGVQIHRDKRVLLPHQNEPNADQIEVQILPPRGGPTLVVVLYPGDCEWDCDCQHEACEHAAAAAIALNHPDSNAPRAPEGSARPAPPPANVAEVAYAFRRMPQGLSLMRLSVSPSGQEPLGIALKVRQQQQDAPKLIVRQSDMVVDAVLAGRRLPEVLPEAVLVRVLRALVDAPNVTLDNKPIFVGDSRSAHLARVTRRAGGEHVVQLVPGGGFDETFANGVGRRKDRMTPLTQVFLPPRDRAALEQGISFGESELPRLLDDVLPRLERQIPVEWHGVAAPTRTDAPVTALFHLQVQYDEAAPGEVPIPRLRVVPQLVYGPPVIARVVGDQMLASERLIPRRRREDETQWLERLEHELSMAPQQASIARGDAGAALLVRVRGFALRYGAIVDDASGATQAFRSRRPPQARLEEQDGGYSLYFECQGEQPDAPPTRIPAQALLHAYSRGESTLALADGGFAPLPRFLHAHHEALRSFLAARDMAQSLRSPNKSHQLPGWAMAQLGRLCEALAVPPPSEARRAFEALASTDAGEAVQADTEGAVALEAWLAGGRHIGNVDVWPVPADITLRPYQARGVAWLAKRLQAGIGALLADDMGLGKTLQALLSSTGRVLTVVPTSLLANWTAEAERFCPGRPVHVFHGARRVLPALGHNDLVLTTYGVLRQDASILSAADWDVVMLDEAHAIKSPQSQVAQAAMRLGQSAKARLAISGTPLENRLDELWSLLHFCNPGLFGERDAFVKRFGEQGEGPSALAGAIAPLMLRRKKSAVEASLPPKSEVLLRCTLSDVERQIYDAISFSTRTHIVEQLEAGGSVIEALEALLRLRQAACHPALVPGHARESSSAKLDALIDTLTPAVAEGHRALVFSQWTSLLDLVEPRLRAENINFVRLDGSTNNRGEVVRRFSDAMGPPVMLISLKAGGVGLNLTSADHVFLLDPWWNPAAEDQAADRAHRIGQTRKVLVHKVVATDTIDEQLIAMQAKKRALAAESLGDVSASEAGSAEQKLGREELLALLRHSYTGH